MNNQCSPKFAGDSVSCFSREALLDIVDAYNRNNNDYIQIPSQANKTQIWRTIQNRLQKNCGDNEACWLDQPFLNTSSTKNLNLAQYFKPKAPLGRYQWLTTDDIYKVMSQWEEKYPDFKFVGPLPMDFLKLNDSESRFLQRLNLKRCPYKLIGCVFNLDPSTKSGSHWVAMAIDRQRREIAFFDSYGNKYPTVNRYNLPYFDSHGNLKQTQTISMPLAIQEFVSRVLGNNLVGGSRTSNRSAYKVRVNDVQHQYANSECGIYSMLFLIKTLKGQSFEQIAQDIVLDEQANQLRDWFFRRN